MQFHLLPDDLTRLVDGVEPSEVLSIPKGDLCLYKSVADTIADTMLDRGFLNMILRDHSGRRYGFSIAEFENTPVTVVNQEGLEKLNASCIIGVFFINGLVGTQHWECFLTTFDPETMEVLGQKFIQ